MGSISYACVCSRVCVCVWAYNLPSRCELGRDCHRAPSLGMGHFSQLAPYTIEENVISIMSYTSIHQLDKRQHALCVRIDQLTCTGFSTGYGAGIGTLTSYLYKWNGRKQLDWRQREILKWSRIAYEQYMNVRNWLVHMNWVWTIDVHVYGNWHILINWVLKG